MSRSWSIVPAGVLTVLLTAVSGAQGTCNPATTKAVPIALVASGGIAKGAYQAGGLWAILQRARRQRDLGGTSPDSMPSIASISGASAGNVNTLLMALEWATPIRQGVNSELNSLLWKTWTRVGIDGLVPVGPRPIVESLLDVAAFDGAKAEVSAAQRREGYLRCRVPLGISMTRTSQRGTYPVRDMRDVVVQRYTSINAFETTTSGFVLRPLDSSEVSRGIGAAVTARDSTGTTLRLSDFLEHVQASAAFPVAFPPHRIAFRYFEGQNPSSSCQLKLLEPQACPDTASDVFLDGGVFDNNPLTLAIDLTHGERAAKHPSALNAWFVSPGQRRNIAIKRDSLTHRSENDHFGAVRYLSFAAGLINTAADYELFSLERRLQDAGIRCGAPEPEKNLCVSFTTRYFPIYGATANSFGAFLGKPLREIDFYIGVYDGVYADAQYGPCKVPPGTPPNTGCINREITRVITTPNELPELSEPGREILTAMRLREFEPGAASVASRNERVLRLIELLDQLRAADAVQDNEDCKKLGTELAMFCTDGLRAALKAQSHSVHRAARTALDGETDEARFDAVLDDFDAEMFRIVRPLIYRQWIVESNTSEARYLTRAIAKIGTLVVAKHEEDYRHGWQWDPSTVPDHANEGNLGYHRVFHAFPYSADVWSGYVRATWSPSYIVRPGYAFSLGPSVALLAPRWDRLFHDSYEWSASARVRTPAYQVPHFPDSGIQAAWDCRRAECRRSIAQLGLSLSNRFNVGLGWEAETLGDKYGFRKGAVVLGVNDVAGLLHLFAPQM